MIGSRGGTALSYKDVVPGEFRAIEVGVIVISACFENDHIFPGADENGGGSSPTGTRADNANVAREFGVLLIPEYVQGPARVGCEQVRWTGIADFVPHRCASAVQVRQHHVEVRDGFAQSLKCGAAAISELSAHESNTRTRVFFGKSRKARGALDRNDAVQMRIPEIKQLQKLLTIGRTGIEIHGVGDSLGNA